MDLLSAQHSATSLYLGYHSSASVLSWDALNQQAAYGKKEVLIEFGLTEHVTVEDKY